MLSVVVLKLNWLSITSSHGKWGNKNSRRGEAQHQMSCTPSTCSSLPPLGKEGYHPKGNFPFTSYSSDNNPLHGPENEEKRRKWSARSPLTSSHNMTPTIAPAKQVRPLVSNLWLWPSNSKSHRLTPFLVTVIPEHSKHHSDGLKICHTISNTTFNWLKVNSYVYVWINHRNENSHWGLSCPSLLLAMTFPSSILSKNHHLSKLCNLCPAKPTMWGWQQCFPYLWRHHQERHDDDSKKVEEQDSCPDWQIHSSEDCNIRSCIIWGYDIRRQCLSRYQCNCWTSHDRGGNGDGINKEV